MASACVNKIGISADFPPSCSSSFGWLSPRISFSREEEPKPIKSPPTSAPSASSEKRDPEFSMGDFEFRLEEDPVKMLPADELFADGKLMPLHIHRQSFDSKEEIESIANDSARKSSSHSLIVVEEEEEEELGTRASKAPSWTSDPYLFSPKAPRCSSRWRELLGLKRQQQQQLNNNPKQGASKNSNPNPSRSLKYFLHRNNSKSDSIPLLKCTDAELVSISSRLSLSSSSSSGGADQEDLPRISLDYPEKPINKNPNPNPQSMRVKIEKKPKPRPASATRPASSEHPNRAGRSSVRSSTISSRGVSVDSPRMNSSGKIVFQSLERSSSSPSSFNGGPNRIKSRGMERSYSANVRVTPVLNVPVCSLRGSSKSGSVFGFGQLFSSSPQKKDGYIRTQVKRNRNSNSNSNRVEDRSVVTGLCRPIKYYLSGRE